MGFLSNILNLGLVVAGIRIAIPILLAGLGGLFTLQANILNIGMEGMMLFGAWAGVFVSYMTGSVWLALLAAVGVGLLAAVIFGLFGVRYRCNIIVAGMGLNLFAGAFTMYLLRSIFRTRGSLSDPRIVGVPTLTLPVIDKIPFLGPLLSGHSLLVYVAFVLVAVVHYFLYRTPTGLRIRAVGEHAEAARSVGVDPARVQFLAVLISGAFSGLAGAYLSLAQLRMFVENMVSGRGFIALAAIYFGRGTPVGTLVAALIFGLAEALSMRLQTLGFPSQFMLMIPYVVTVAVLIVVSRLAAVPRRLKLPSFTEEARE
ncbi:MAG: ral nucleoside transport system permease protein [Bacillota bacterium]|nr:ral nucleoside transport system permease protein [Bacillota bacterium]MDK2924616.1 ral nucleoside transport system permease protein [Bacillota bacterium]